VTEVDIALSKRVVNAYERDWVRFPCARKDQGAFHLMVRAKFRSKPITGLWVQVCG
jgi:hypothetical protein